MKKEQTRTSFKSRWGFILASVGSAVGMANVWGFPNKMGSNGGGAFLLIYLLFIFLFSYVGLPAEFAIGRWSRTGTLGSYENAWRSRNEKLAPAGRALGWLPLAGSLCIAIGYSIIVAYVLKAFVDSASGLLMQVNTSEWFESFSMTDFSVVPFHIIIIIGTLLTLLLGASSIEKSNKIMMPLFFLIFVVLAARVALLPGSASGYEFMFIPRWEALKDHCHGAGVLLPVRNRKWYDCVWILLRPERRRHRSIETYRDFRYDCSFGCRACDHPGMLLL